jgi:hypothetical protein
VSLHGSPCAVFGDQNRRLRENQTYRHHNN